MQHFAHFGYVKAANKQLKKLQEIKSRSSDMQGLGELAKGRYDRGEAIINSRKEYSRMAREPLEDYLASPLRRITKENVAQPLQVPKTGWSDIRQTSDDAISKTGYSGFRTDPHKGYGGMMEESIPIEDLYPNGFFKTVNKYSSRLTGRTL
jgi:hypothetical protein